MSETMTEDLVESLSEELENDLAAAFTYGASGTDELDSAGITERSGERHGEETPGSDDGVEDANPEEENEWPDDEDDDETEESASGTPGCPPDDTWPYGRNEVAQDRPPSRDISTKELGKRGEDAATNYLIRKGYRILERNWTCKFGEADIISMDDEGTVVFVEVKTRRTDEAGLPEEAITPEKQRRYEKLALTYMIEANWDDDVNLRFDAICINVTGDFKAILKHHKGCFDGNY